MSAPYNIKRRTEDAVQLVITQLRGSELSGYTFYKGFSGTELAGPRIEIVAANLEPVFVGQEISAHRLVRITCDVIDHYAVKTRANHARAEGAISDIWYRNDVAMKINALIDIQDYVCDVWTPGAEEDAVNLTETEHRTRFSAEVVCHPKLTA